MKTFSFLIIFSIVALAFGFSSEYDPGEWYRLIYKPSWALPGIAYKPVWAVLYTTMGIALWQVVLEQHPIGFRASVWWLILVVLNVMWAWLFFGLKMPGLTLIGISFLFVALLFTIHWFKRIKLSAAAWLTPYLFWFVFLAVMNLNIWWLNGGRTIIREFLHLA